MEAPEMYDMVDTWVALKRDNLGLLHEWVAEYGADAIDVGRYLG